MLALQTTPFLIIGRVIGFVISDTHANWFFAIALLAVGARYLVFQTIYGIPLFIILGAVMIDVGFVSIWLFAAAAISGGDCGRRYRIAVFRCNLASTRTQELKRFHLGFVQLHAPESTAPFGNGFGEKQYRCSDPLVFWIVGKANHFHACFFVRFARRHIAALDITARTGDVRTISRANAGLTFDAVPIPGQPQCRERQ